MTGWQWHHLDHIQIICTSLETDIDQRHHLMTQIFTGQMLFLMPCNNDSSLKCGHCSTNCCYLSTALAERKPKPTVSCTNCWYVCAYYWAWLSFTLHSGTVLILFPLILQTDVIAQMLSVGGQGISSGFINTKITCKKTLMLFTFCLSYYISRMCWIICKGVVVFVYSFRILWCPRTVIWSVEMMSMRTLLPCFCQDAHWLCISLGQDLATLCITRRTESSTASSSQQRPHNARTYCTCCTLMLLFCCSWIITLNWW